MNAIKNINIDAVITSYNQGEMIREAVNSVCNQTYLPQKLIIVDDSSKDEKSLKVLHELEKENLPVSLEVIYQDNGGVSNARNTGIHRANAEYVLVLDGMT